MSRLAVDVSAPSRASDELVVATPGRKLTGWTDVAVTLRCEGFPPSFEVALSSRAADGQSFTVVAPGDPCEIYLGDDLVITGYVDRLGEGGGASEHALQILGRGKTQDLVDCSAEWPSGQIAEATALEIATRLAGIYGIEVALTNGAEAGPKVPQFNLSYGETAADIVQRVARNAHLLAYEDPRGRLCLAALGDQQAASGIVYGDNVERWHVERSIDGRYSEIVCALLAQDTLSDAGEGGFFFDTEVDPNVPRHRRLYMVLEQVAAARDFAIRKAIWEVARRAGRSTVATVTVDSWRDGAGALWLPNTLVPVSLPGLPEEVLLCLSEVTFRRGDDGTHADLVLMPQEAFLPEPISLQPVNLSDIEGASQ